MREIADVDYPDAGWIRVVLDNLSTHTPARSMPPSRPPRRRSLERLEFHYTPKHASWLNMVEIEIGVLKRQCLDRRIDDCEDSSRNHRLATQAQSRGAHLKWMFSTEKARTKMGRAYPRPAATLDDEPVKESTESLCRRTSGSGWMTPFPVSPRPRGDGPEVLIYEYHRA